MTRLNRGPIRVLLVDALADERAMYGVGLRLLGLELSAVVGVAEALATAGTFNPDAIVLHLESAEWNLCDALGADARTRDVPVVVITAGVRPDRANRERALATANCAAFVGKPCTHEDLAAVIERVVGGERRIELTSSLDPSLAAEAARGGDEERGDEPPPGERAAADRRTK